MCILVATSIDMENAYGVWRNRYKRNIPDERKFELITPVNLDKLK